MKKKKDFHFTFNHFIRLSLFALLIFYLINYFSQTPQNTSETLIDDPTVLGIQTQSQFPPPLFNDLYLKLSPDTRQKIEAIPSLPVIIKSQQQIEALKKQANGFPQKQINQFKKELIRSIADDLIDKVDDTDQNSN